MRKNRTQGYHISPLNEIARGIEGLEIVMKQLYFMDRKAGIEETYEAIYLNVIQVLRSISTELQMHYELEMMEQQAEYNDDMLDTFMNVPEGAID